MIDEARLNELKDDFGADGLAEIIEAFVEEARGAVDEIAPFCDTGPSPERADRFHFLKGCARNIGAVELGRMCEVMEASPEPFSSRDYADLRSAWESVERDLTTRTL